MGVGHHLSYFRNLDGFSVTRIHCTSMLACLSLFPVKPRDQSERQTLGFLICYRDSLTNMHMPLSCHTKGAQRDMHSTHRREEVGHSSTIETMAMSPFPAKCLVKALYGFVLRLTRIKHHNNLDDYV